MNQLYLYNLALTSRMALHVESHKEASGSLAEHSFITTDTSSYIVYSQPLSVTPSVKQMPNFFPEIVFDVRKD